MNDHDDVEVSGILDEPIQPGWFRVCPECRAWFALVFKNERSDELQGTISTFRCRQCDAVVEFAESHPEDAV